MHQRAAVWIVAAAVLVGCGATSSRAQSELYASGGELSQEQASYDVSFYDLDVRVQPADSSIAGYVTTTARIVQPMRWFVLDLDPRLDVEEASEDDVALPFERRGDELWIDLQRTRQPGTSVTVRVEYGGIPRVAPNPPWDGGLTWARTAGGDPWIATSCQVTGADVWWPVKDHPSDEPDSMAIRFTVPEPLTAASNGRLRDVEEHGDGWRTFHWFVSTPINVYNVALNAAPYEAIEETHTGPGGESYPVVFYVLPEDIERGRAFMDEIHDQLTFFEERFGPYPFRADKYGVVQTPHLGMEHQTIIAYGANFNNAAMTGRDWGFDALHHHELAHEWFGNLVTNVDWSDMWLHEGFGTYTQALYMEELDGSDGYHAYMNSIEGGIQNRVPVAPDGPLSSAEIYGGDIYNKGAWVLHMLRYLIDDDPTFDLLLRRMAYPDPALEEVTDGSHTRFAVTEDFVTLAEETTGRELSWFFDVYLRAADVPRLAAIRQGDRLTVRWDAPLENEFPMPVEVQLGAEIVRVEMAGDEAVLDVPPDVDPIIDPNNWLLSAGT
jgi:aminopeptidase N